MALLLYFQSRTLFNLHDTEITTTEPDNLTTSAPNGQFIKESEGEAINIPNNSKEHGFEALLKDEIFPRLERIRKICGPLCDVDSMEKLAAITIVGNKTLLPHVRARVNCQAIMASEDIDASENSVPYPLPDQLHYLYSLNGAVEVSHLKRFSNIYLGKNALENHWDEEKIETIIMELKNGKHGGSYGFHQTNQVLHHLNATGKIHGSRVLVIGSERPWLEAICLLLGAKEVVTLEYGKIVSTHPKIKTMTPNEFRQEYMRGNLGFFDTITSFSSLEHSGLGRYGDALNPWGDLLAVARSWCVTRPGGALVLGLPTGRDCVVMNAHRIYGAVRWPLLAANWIQVDSDLHNKMELLEDNTTGKTRLSQLVFVFEKLEGIK